LQIVVAGLTVKTGGFAFSGRQGLFASVSPDRCHIFLCEGDQGNSGSWVWTGVADSEALFEEYRRRGVKIRHPVITENSVRISTSILMAR